MTARQPAALALVAWIGAGLAGAPAAAAGGPPPARTDGAAPSYGATPPEFVPYRLSAEPYRRFFDEPPAFRGPGRDEPEPEGLASVRIGLLAPLSGTDDDDAGLSLRRGVDLALEEANAAGGYRGLPYELAVRNDRQIWGASSNDIVTLSYDEKVWAVIGSIDPNSTHVALRTALKTELLMVTAGSSDPTMTETRIPWIVRVTPDDRQTCYALARLLFEERGYRKVAVLRSNDRYGRTGIAELRDAARRLRRPLPLEVNFLPDAVDFTPQLDRLEAAHPEAVVLWARADVAGRALKALRERGIAVEVAGPDRLVSQRFLAAAGAAAEGTILTYPFDPERDDERWTAFRTRFRARFGTDPDLFSAYGYEAARMIVEGLRATGLNRVRLRDRLCGLRSWDGVMGTLRFDATSNNIQPPVVGRVRGGRFHFAAGAAERAR